MILRWLLIFLALAVSGCLWHEQPPALCRAYVPHVLPCTDSHYALCEGNLGNQVAMDCITVGDVTCVRTCP